MLDANLRYPAPKISRISEGRSGQRCKRRGRKSSRRPEWDRKFPDQSRFVAEWLQNLSGDRLLLPVARSWESPGCRKIRHCEKHSSTQFLKAVPDIWSRSPLWSGIARQSSSLATASILPVSESGFPGPQPLLQRRVLESQTPRKLNFRRIAQTPPELTEKGSHV